MKTLLISLLTACITSCSNIPNDFFKGISINLKTDAGDITGSQDAITGKLIIDQRSGK